VVKGVRDRRDTQSLSRPNDLGHAPDALVVLEDEVTEHPCFGAHRFDKARCARRFVLVGPAHVQHGHAVRIAKEVEHAGGVAQLGQAAPCHFRLQASRVDVLARMHREPDAQVSRQLSGRAQIIAVLGLPVVGKSRVRGERDQILPHPEEPDPVLRVPPQDNLQIGDVRPDQFPDLFCIRKVSEPQRTVRARRYR